MKDSTRNNIVEGSIWVRGLHMLIFAVAYNLIEAALALTAIYQFISALITGRVNEPLLQFAKNGSIYIQEVLEFLTFNSEIRPFPFTPWPDEAHTGEEWLGEEIDDEFDVDTDAGGDPLEAADDDHPVSEDDAGEPKDK